MDEKFKELFRKGHVKGTVVVSRGNEATAVGMSYPFRPNKDVLSLLHRDLGSHLVMGADLYSIVCQHYANAESPTHGREGNVHHGDAASRRLPMISHLGSMLSLVVGGVWSARNKGEDVYGLNVIGDGGSSTGQFHESLNIASVRKVPVLFVVENNNYAYSTPVVNQFNCKHISDRAFGYGISGKSIDGTDVWEVYNSVLDAIATMKETSLPYLLESRTLRLEGHAVYDNAEYVSAAEREEWFTRDPLMKARKVLIEELAINEIDVAEVEELVQEEINAVTFKALRVGRPDPKSPPWIVYAPGVQKKIAPYRVSNVRNLTAINAALDHVMSSDDSSFLCGQDVGKYGSPFKTCKGLFDKFGPKRVVDMPICEAGTVGFCLGATQTGSKPIMEFQFADFSTEAVTQLGLNCGTWYYRTGVPVPILFRFPCGGGITLGAFHSGEYGGLWGLFSGLKIFYPSTPQESYEAIVAGFHDPNPCLVLEHKMMYWGTPGEIDFDGDLTKIERPRQYTEGSDVTIVALGAMANVAINAVKTTKYTASVWNPFILNPLKLDEIAKSVRSTGRLLVIQESSRIAGNGDGIMSRLTQACFKDLKCAPVLVSAPDTPVPFAKELETKYIPGQDTIICALEEMIGVSR